MMKQTLSLLVIILLINGAVHAQTELNDSLKIDLFLNETVFKNQTKDIKLLDCIDYSPTGFVMLASPNQFYMLGIGGIFPAFRKQNMRIDAFTVTEDNALLVVSKDKLCYVDTTGYLSALYDLPIFKAGIISGSENDDIYIYDRIFEKKKKKYALYKISENKQYERILSLPNPITSACEYKNSLLISSGNRIICADNKTKKFFELISLPQKSDRIISITSDSTNHVLYFSTSNAIYRAKDNRFENVCQKIGGILKYDDEGLLVFNPDNKIMFRFRNDLLYPTEKNEQQIPEVSRKNCISEEKLRCMSLHDIRNLVLQKNIGEAVSAYAHLVAKDSLNTSLLAEYSYVLALTGAFDCALMNLDRARFLSHKKEILDFYSGLVFSLMGYNGLFEEFVKNISDSKIPKWISYNDHMDLLSTFQLTPKLVAEDYLTAIKRVNYLTASGLYLQAIALYEEITNVYPTEYLHHVGYSIPLEKVGLYQIANQELVAAIKIIGDSYDDIEVKNVIEKRIKELAEKVSSPQKLKHKWLNFKNDFNPQTMLYIGGMVAEKTVTFDSRFGMFFTNTFNGAVDLGLSSVSSDFKVNLGVSGYQRFGVFVWGEGLSLQMGNPTVLNLKSSVGFSFISRKRNSSWDIFFDWYLPIGKNVKSSYGISIGKSIYFGKRK